jgi:hypothetical protein
MFICELLQGGGHRQIRSDPIYEEADVTMVSFGGRQWVGEEIGEGDVA